MKDAIKLSDAEHAELSRRAANRTGRTEEARRARVILLLDEGLTWDEVMARAGCSRGFISLWSQRFRDRRLAGLCSRHRGRTADVLTPKLEARILNATRRPPADGTTHWSTRRLGAHLGISHMMVQRVWTKHRIRTHPLVRDARHRISLESVVTGHPVAAGEEAAPGSMLSLQRVHAILSGVVFQSPFVPTQAIPQGGLRVASKKKGASSYPDPSGNVTLTLDYDVALQLLQVLTAALGGEYGKKKPKPKPKGKPKTKPKGKPKTKPKTKPKGKPKTKPKGKPKTKPKGKPKTKPKGKPKTKPKGKPKTTPKPVTGPTPKPAAKRVATAAPKASKKAPGSSKA